MNRPDGHVYVTPGLWVPFDPDLMALRYEIRWARNGWCVGATVFSRRHGLSVGGFYWCVDKIGLDGVE